MRINGKTEGSVFVRGPLEQAVSTESHTLPEGDLPTEVLAGWIPGMAGTRREHALVVGWGTGVSSRALLETGVADLVGVEIEPAVFDAARVFDAAVLTDPRVRLFVDDARAVLARTARRIRSTSSRRIRPIRGSPARRRSSRASTLPWRAVGCVRAGE